MIRLTRLNGSEFSLNPDLIHRAEETPDTVLTLIDGSRYVVVESLDELIGRIVGYRARVVAEAGLISSGEVPGPTTGSHAGPYGAPDGSGPIGADPADEPGADVVRLRTRRA